MISCSNDAIYDIDDNGHDNFELDIELKLVFKIVET